MSWKRLTRSRREQGSDARLRKRLSQLPLFECTKTTHSTGSPPPFFHLRPPHTHTSMYPLHGSPTTKLLSIISPPQTIFCRDEQTHPTGPCRAVRQVRAPRSLRGRAAGGGPGGGHGGARPGGSGAGGRRERCGAEEGGGGGGRTRGGACGRCAADAPHVFRAGV